MEGEARGIEEERERYRGRECMIQSEEERERTGRRRRDTEDVVGRNAEKLETAKRLLVSSFHPVKRFQPRDTETISS